MGALAAEPANRGACAAGGYGRRMTEYLSNDVTFDNWQQVGRLLNDAWADLADDGWDLVSCVPELNDGGRGGVARMVWRKDS